ncbi:YlbF family regulator [Ornithinibacillus sp. 4-3]|uniref:YlbF family regulator n=1 Tax=Ornithinibacillus sp. 4-3 TaxID=3231488 RepID=A0AB39HWA8_9BACI
MIGTLEYVDVLDRAELLGKMILDSDIMKAYYQAKHELENDPEAQQLIKAFNDIKLHYEDVQRFGRYHPDYNEIMKEVRASKRNMDLNGKVSAFKVAERNLQRLLDEISETLAFSVSTQIMVPKEGALFAEGGCASGSCGTGGGCSCKAS